MCKIFTAEPKALLKSSVPRIIIIHSSSSSIVKLKNDAALGDLEIIDARLRRHKLHYNYIYTIVYPAVKEKI